MLRRLTNNYGSVKRLSNLKNYGKMVQKNSMCIRLKNTAPITNGCFTEIKSILNDSWNIMWNTDDFYNFRKNDQYTKLIKNPTSTQIAYGEFKRCVVFSLAVCGTITFFLLGCVFLTTCFVAPFYILIQCFS